MYFIVAVFVWQWFFFLNGIQSMQDWRVTTRHGVKQKEEEAV